MDRSALEVIAGDRHGGQLAILVKTIDTLKKLGDGDRAMRIFDIQARQDLSGNFQIGAAQKGDNGANVGRARRLPLRADDNRETFLFGELGRRRSAILDRGRRR